MIIIDKAVVYVTYRQPETQKDQLLIFQHTDFPEAGIQVPAGTVKPGENPEEAALREAREESGLQNLRMVSFLGTRMFDARPYGKDQLHRRFVYHFEALGDLPDTWRHLETDPSDQSAESYEFEFWWAGLPDDVPPLAGEQDAMLGELQGSIGHAAWIRQCYSLARFALQKGNHPFGALIVKDGSVLAAAENTVNQDRDVTRHAEMNLVSSAARTFSRETLSESTLYTSTEPCVMCTGAIYWAGIRRIVYGVAAETLAQMAGETFVLNSRTLLGEGRSQSKVVGPVLEEEGVDALRSWDLLRDIEEKKE